VEGNEANPSVGKFNSCATALFVFSGVSLLRFRGTFVQECAADSCRPLQKATTSVYIRPPPNAARRYNKFIRSSSLLLVLDTNPEHVPCCTALLVLVVSKLKQLQKDTRNQYIVPQKRAIAENVTIKEQEPLLRIRMQARSLLCKISVGEKMAHEESALQLLRTYAKIPPFPSTMLKPSLIQVMADCISPSAAMATASASVTLKSTYRQKKKTKNLSQRWGSGSPNFQKLFFGASATLSWWRGRTKEGLRP
jgi:hypothetical protein